MIEAPPDSGPPYSGVGDRHLESRTPRQNGRVRSPRRQPLLNSAGLVSLVQYVALVPIVAWDGTAPWRVARVVGVSMLTALVVWLRMLPVL